MKDCVKKMFVRYFHKRIFPYKASHFKLYSKILAIFFMKL